VNNKLRAEIFRRADKDQAMRNKVIETNNMSLWDDRIDKENTDWLNKHVKKYGWPTISEVGEDGAQAAWLLVQHSDHDITFQIHCLKLMKKLPKSEVLLRNIAYLEDRVLVAQNKPQLYGTQFYKEGAIFEPSPIKNIGTLDKGRKQMGLESFAENEKRIKEAYKN
jgi:hypothetical protein